MDRTERLLDLVALFLDAQEPVSWAQLRESFPEDYADGSDEATERKFERDKAELLELGIPLSYVQGDEDRRDGYVLSRDAYYLPEVDFTPEELAVLYSAGSAALASGAFPGQHDLAHALRKMGFLAGGNPPQPPLRLELGAVGEDGRLAPKLEELWQASASRKKVRLAYASPRSGQGTERTVHPYGLALRRGIWSLVAFCELRQGVRTFHVHRIRELKTNAAKPRSPDFEVPAGFRLEDYVATYPWQHRLHAPLEVEFALEGTRTLSALQLFPGARPDAQEPGRARLSVSYLDGFLRAALALAPDCRVLGPPEAAERFRQMALRAAERHHEREAA